LRRRRVQGEGRHRAGAADHHRGACTYSRGYWAASPGGQRVVILEKRVRGRGGGRGNYPGRYNIKRMRKKRDPVRRKWQRKGAWERQKLKMSGGGGGGERDISHVNSVQTMRSGGLLSRRQETGATTVLQGDGGPIDRASVEKQRPIVTRGKENSTGGTWGLALVRSLVTQERKETSAAQVKKLSEKKDGVRGGGVCPSGSWGTTA